MSKSVQRLGLLANPEKTSCGGAVRQAIDLITAAGREVWADASTARLSDRKLTVCPDSLQLAGQTDLLVVFGGDGTMLRVAREVAGISTPILGINVGGLGFLTAVPLSQLAQALDLIWSGACQVETRPLMAASGVAQGQRIEQVALNDFVFGRGGATRMVDLEVSVDGEVLTCYRCDGLIVSSPTGSTAYSLSAGGAIVCPAAEVFTLTPICPHTLSNRSVIVSLDSAVQVQVHSLKVETILTADGQVQTVLAARDCITIRRAQRTVNLVHLQGSSFFATLRQKLDWSGSHVS